MPESRLQPNAFPVKNFIDGIPNPQIRQDCWTLFRIMSEAAQAMPRMWGMSTVGFGQFRATDINGKEKYWMLIGFSPRKQSIALYIMVNSIDHSTELLAGLGKYTHGKGCLIIKSLADVDLAILKELVSESVAYKTRAHPMTESEQTRLMGLE
jgi:hypothetical protein